MSFFAAISDEVGIFGVLLILIAYYLLCTNKISAHTIKYHVLNCVGAILMLYSLYFNWNTASVSIEIAWVMISVMGMYRVVKSRSVT